MKLSVLTFLLFSFSIISMGQVSDSINIYQQRIEDSLNEIQWQLRQDSLRMDFLNQPRNILVEFEINGKIQPSNQYEFALLDSLSVQLLSSKGKNYYTLESTDTNKKLILARLIFNSDTISYRINEGYLQYGGFLSFGLITNLKDAMKNRKESQDEEVTEGALITRKLVHQKQVRKRIRKYKGLAVKYLKIAPRVFGCGSTTLIYTYYKPDYR